MKVNGVHQQFSSQHSTKYILQKTFKQVYSNRLEHSNRLEQLEGE